MRYSLFMRIYSCEIFSPKNQGLDFFSRVTSCINTYTIINLKKKKALFSPSNFFMVSEQNLNHSMCS